MGQARKKILQNQKFLKYVQECPVKCLWLKSKIAQLSPTAILSDNFYNEEALASAFSENNSKHK